MYFLCKHPVELVYSWMKKGYGKSFYENPRNAGMTFKHKNHTIPYYAVGWEDLFITLNDTDRIIYMINHMNKVSEIEYDDLSDNHKIRLKPVYFDNLIEEPEWTDGNYVLGEVI